MFKFWQDKKVLVTGHTGFKGSWLSICLESLGAEVIGYSLKPYTDEDNFVLADLDKRMTSIIGNVCDYNSLSDIINQYKPEFVFHLAAQSLVSESYSGPKETYDVNVGGTVNLLESCRHSSSVRVIVVVTSDKCYENKESNIGYKETDRLGGYDPYSSSKAAAEIVTHAYRRSFFNHSNVSPIQALSSVRAGNVIGGGDWRPNRLIPDCVMALRASEPIIVRSPDSIRPWQHVLEPIHGYMLLAHKMSMDPKKYSGAWNFGPDKKSKSKVSDVTNRITQLWGDVNWEVSGEQHLHEAILLNLCSNKSKKILD